MPELNNDRNIFSLFEVASGIKKTLADRYKNSFWVKAELNKLNYYNQSGHCYPDLVEKKNGKVIAQIRSTLWKDDFFRINNQFRRILNESLKDGIKILIHASIAFDPVYGLSFRIIDIDPSYTLGDLEREKQETIQRLTTEGIFGKNKLQSLPLLPQRLAIISVESSKGYADFLRIVDNNPWNYKFFHLLFPSLLQSEKAIEGILYQLQRIKKVIHHFDAVAIIRGGGGDIGLSCYNDYELSKAIALFPIPVLTGIGHATNETVAEMVAHTNTITPTKLGEFLLQKFHDFSVPVQNAQKSIADLSLRMLRDKRSKLQSGIQLFRSVTENILNSNRNDIKMLFQSIRNQSNFHLKNEKNTLNNMESNVKNMHPANVLKRGYSITLKNNKAVMNADELKEGDVIKTMVYNGNILSIVDRTITEHHE